MNKYLNLTLENIDNEHICCAISDPKHIAGLNYKKEWLKERIKEGHCFRKLDARGKVFIEYAPLETAWVPIDGKNFLYIYCLWVSGKFKGQGFAGELLDYVIHEAQKEGKGVCVISSLKKKPFLSDSKFFKYHGFKTVDRIGEFELLSLSFENDEPRFNENARKMKINSKDLTIYYSPECPYTINCIKEIEEYTNENNIAVHIIKIDTLSKAKEVPCVFNNWAVFLDGKFVSNTLLNKNSLKKMLK